MGIRTPGFSCLLNRFVFISTSWNQGLCFWWCWRYAWMQPYCWSSQQTRCWSSTHVSVTSWKPFVALEVPTVCPGSKPRGIETYPIFIGNLDLQVHVPNTLWVSGCLRSEVGVFLSYPVMVLPIRTVLDDDILGPSNRMVDGHVWWPNSETPCRLFKQPRDS